MTSTATALATFQAEIFVPKTVPGASADEQANPYRYGWRYVRHVRPDGSEEFEQVPLTLEDVLHPQEEDFIVHSEAHQRRLLYLYAVFLLQVASDPTAIVLCDVRIAWDVPGLKAHGPDLAVIFGVRARKDWGTFDVAVEGVRPDLIVEITSPETAQMDRLVKVNHYETARVPFYILIDMVEAGRRTAPRLYGYELTSGGYQPLTPDERGRLWLPPVRAWLGVENGEIVCDDEADRPIRDFPAEVAARVAAEQRAEVAEGRAEAAERQARAEAAARAEAEARLRAMEAELRRLRGEAGE